MNWASTLASMIHSIPSIVLDVERVFHKQPGTTKKQNAVQLVMDGLGLATSLLPDRAGALEAITVEVGTIIDSTVKILHSTGDLIHKPKPPVEKTPAELLLESQQASGAASGQQSGT